MRAIPPARADRRIVALAACFLIALLVIDRRADAAASTAAVEQWGIYEVALKGPTDGNPFTDVRFTAVFTDLNHSIEVAGFYDGDGVYKIRFMPDKPGAWSYETKSNRWDLTAKTGSFTVTLATGANHGPVGIHNTYHFAHADGAPFCPLGTTCYSWTHRGDAMEELTLKTLASAPFNKIRMGVFPQAHGIKFQPVTLWPYAGTPPRSWDFTRFNPAFFQHLEKRVGDLRDLGIECDLILFHSYDDDEEWGFETMDQETDDRYLRYIVARLAAYRNIWWSIGNEFDFLKTKTESDWDRYFQVVQKNDPYGHLRSIHNGKQIYNNNQPWVTHASIQNGAAVEDVGRAELYREVWRKPVIYDEVEYEGNHNLRWAQISGEEMVHRFWVATVAGTYASHSEFFADDKEVVWLGQGGTLKGTSPQRLAFLRKILEDSPPDGLEPIDKWHWDPMAGKPGEYYLVYLERKALKSWPFQIYRTNLEDGMHFKVEVIDTWNMTITPVEGDFVTKKKDSYHFVDAKGRAVELPGKPGMALRIRRVEAGGTK